jgi:hypothetical protein
MADSPTPKSPPKTPPKDADHSLLSAASKKPEDQSSDSLKSSDTVEGLGTTSPKNDGDANASPNDDVLSHSPPSGVDESSTSPKDNVQSYSPPKGVDESSCMLSGRAEGSPGIGDSTRYGSADKSPTPPRADSPSTTNDTKSPTGSTHSHSPSKDVDESCVLTTPKSDSQGDSLNTTMTGLDGLTPMSVLHQVASKVSSNLFQATVSKGRCTFGQLKKNIGKFSVSQDSNSPKPMESPSLQWSQEPAPTIMAATVRNAFWEVGAKYIMFSADIVSCVAIWFVENDVESWDKLQERIELIDDSVSFEEAMWELSIGSLCIQDTKRLWYASSLSSRFCLPLCPWH